MTITFATVSTAIGGPLGYAVCQADCCTIVTVCYAVAGATFGTVLAASAPADILACNAAQGTCYAACAAVAFGPTL